MAKRKIFLFRHGQTTYNRDKRFTGWKNATLTFLGKKQANLIAKKLKNKKFEIAIHSSLLRSINTLKPVLRYHPECVKVIKDDRITERSYGKLSGKLHKTIIQKHGKEQFEKWHRGFSNRPPKGESFADVEKRVRSFIKDLKKLMKKEKVNVAISAHGNSIRLFRKIMEKASKKQTVKWNISYTNFYEYTIIA
jgi:2,3-bisphosphoglycerate-dependent phosphoglycerate mutase